MEIPDETLLAMYKKKLAENEKKLRHRMEYRFELCHLLMTEEVFTWDQLCLIDSHIENWSECARLMIEMILEEDDLEIVKKFVLCLKKTQPHLVRLIIGDSIQLSEPLTDKQLELLLKNRPFLNNTMTRHIDEILMDLYKKKLISDLQYEYLYSILRCDRARRLLDIASNRSVEELQKIWVVCKRNAPELEEIDDDCLSITQEIIDSVYPPNKHNTKSSLFKKVLRLFRPCCAAARPSGTLR